ncbi:MAG: 16S rRNA (guanine(966)-N(2))-methyltransferase RsmD [Lachnospiraceae bacterium]
MRVIAGIAKSLRLEAPEGLDTRPTQDRIKETLFNMIAPGLGDCIFVDLFSGSGSIGIEALSRGAKKCYFVEQGVPASVCITKNLQFTKLVDKATVLKMDAVSSLHHIYEKEVDVIFMDPPYNMEHEKAVLTVLSGVKYVTDDTMIIVEASLDTQFDYLEDLGFEIYKTKKYKTNQHVFIRRVI